LSYWLARAPLAIGSNARPGRDTDFVPAVPRCAGLGAVSPEMPAKIRGTTWPEVC
jgi:hypothetical protein